MSFMVIHCHPFNPLECAGGTMFDGADNYESARSPSGEAIVSGNMQLSNGTSVGFEVGTRFLMRDQLTTFLSRLGDVV